MSIPNAEDENASEDLRLCRLELAQVRAAQEPMLEELAELRHELAETQHRLGLLAATIDSDLLTVPRGQRLTDRGYRWFVRRRVHRTAEWRKVEAIQTSGLFDGAWYLEHYPQAATSGLPPALHYLRIGAEQGYDPGPDFSAASYLVSHPRAAKTGANPLLHHLRAQAKNRQRRGGGGEQE